MWMSADRLNVKLKTKTASEYFVIRSRNIVAMTRGVSSALANCTTSSSDEQTNTINVNIAPTRIPRTARMVSASILESRFSEDSRLCSTRKVTMANTMAATGTTQTEFRR